MEITKEFLLNKIHKTHYGDLRMDCIHKPDVVDFTSINIRVLKNKLIYFCVEVEMVLNEKMYIPTTKEFDLTEDEFENILNKTCEWTKTK